MQPFNIITWSALCHNSKKNIYLYCIHMNDSNVDLIKSLCLVCRVPFKEVVGPEAQPMDNHCSTAILWNIRS